ncbi:penicillin-insensitive murein endopeptidase [Testudinibacter sp. TR-2022]|uniref:penicillin-insensitive murein endopeptidase n=1 Tax=Testudinibacter sp. TR-2022 TaxID=2585029 RepID=UPI00111B4AEE|nr:penicillin-insensitive murein endopeptidase [Testudinibacter sp. TR-2022]TNH07504.1 penicillin-insensitive murein endopeptidase [Pasteurellaceae bacterium Phil11]TNH22671.1 penicillin-insensitive murein endopeptidase [Testudinibacter sp. TR-2022]TNH28952.1 penicillin-insensitive murein endopeptidase [Testudinibacter sp. TR-2022]
MRNNTFIKTVFLSLISFPLFSTSAVASPWEQINSPIQGSANPIGGYSNGCIIGAEALPLRGEGYQVIRSQKNRYYGHPELLAYLQRLGKKAKQAGLQNVLIGDMGMAAGGRFSSGHASHQTGLDADIWLRFGPLTDKQALTPTATLMVNRKAQRVDERVWTPDQTTLIRLAAQDPKVDRIFLNPAIKLKLCQTVTGDRTWLAKIRPWFGHDAHLHVRLACPQGATYCEAQAPVPSGEGCGAELMSWFEPAKPGTQPTPKTPPPLPQLCQMILSQQGKS